PATAELRVITCAPPPAPITSSHVNVHTTTSALDATLGPVNLTMTYLLLPTVVSVSSSFSMAGRTDDLDFTGAPFDWTNRKTVGWSSSGGSTLSSGLSSNVKVKLLSGLDVTSVLGAAAGV